MKRMMGLVMIAALGFTVGACDKKDSGATGTGGAAAAGGTGIKECDDYISKVEACMGKMDPATKAASEPGFKAQRDAWKAAAANNKDATQKGCKSALDSFATAYPTCK
jgi:curli biogenesis system outer membrane secretion channel CsgG